ncbi:MAG: DUF4352 domain-containing protein [Thermoleophilia bacterium]
MKKLLIILLAVLMMSAIGCGSTGEKTTSTKESRFTKYSIGEEFPVTDAKGNTVYMATIIGVISPYDSPYKTTTERLLNHIMFDPKPGYKYARVDVKILNNGSYPGRFIPSDFMLFNERDDGALRAGVESTDTVFWQGGDLLPGQEKTGALIFQMPDAAIPTTIQVWYADDKKGSPKMPEINLTS